LLTEELKDPYSAEKQALRWTQKALRKASAEALRQGIQLHIEQLCEAMRGLLEEAQHEIEDHGEKGHSLRPAGRSFSGGSRKKAAAHPVIASCRGPEMPYRSIPSARCTGAR
jgi:hypothetical protein